MKWEPCLVFSCIILPVAHSEGSWELKQFLTLPPCSLCRHRATKLQWHHSKAAFTSPRTDVYMQNTKCKEAPNDLWAGEKQVWLNTAPSPVPPSPAAMGTCMSSWAFIEGKKQTQTEQGGGEAKTCWLWNVAYLGSSGRKQLVGVKGERDKTKVF